MQPRYFTTRSLVKSIIFLSAFLTVPPVLFCQEIQPKKINIAVLDFENRGGINKEEAASLSDAFQGKIIETNEFIVSDRNRIKTILAEQGFQQSEACSQVECVVEVGKILKVEKMFVGTIGKIGKIYTVNIQLIDVATSQLLQNRSKNTDGSIEELLTDIIPDLASEMASELAKKQVKVSKSSGGSTWLWYVGGVVVAGGVTAIILSSKKGDESSQSQSQQLPDSPSFP
jgi:TolB-like protein